MTPELKNLNTNLKIRIYSGGHKNRAINKGTQQSAIKIIQFNFVKN